MLKANRKHSLTKKSVPNTTMLLYFERSVWKRN